MPHPLPPPPNEPSTHPVDIGDRTEAIIFLVHCPETDRIYAVAVGDSGVLNTASLRVAAPANKQLKGIRWAVDHELPA